MYVNQHIKECDDLSSNVPHYTESTNRDGLVNKQVRNRLVNNVFPASSKYYINIFFNLLMDNKK